MVAMLLRKKNDNGEVVSKQTAGTNQDNNSSNNSITNTTMIEIILTVISLQVVKRKIIKRKVFPVLIQDNTIQLNRDRHCMILV